jgi:hypothetical protein
MYNHDSRAFDRNFHLISGWRASLHDLSKPQWRPPANHASTPISFDLSGKSLVPAAQTLECVETAFVAKSVRWWHVRGKKPIEIVESSRETVNESPFLRWTPVPKQASRVRRLIELASDQNQPIWVEGDPLSADGSSELFAPSHPRMFTWLIVNRSRRGVLEVVLEADRNGVSGNDREIYLRALHLLRDDFYRNMQAVPEPVSISPLQVLQEAHSHHLAEHPAAISLEALADLSSILEQARRETIGKIERHLQSIAGARLDSLQANQMLAKSLHVLLDSHGFRLRCPECGTPAIMRCLAAGNSQTGAFVFDHVLAHGRTFHGGKSSIPKLEVVAKPTRHT